MTLALILKVMAATGKTLSTLIDEQPQYFIEKGKVACPENKKEMLLQELAAETDGPNVSRIDGIKIWFEDKSAILLRPSGTEPIFRLYSEAKSQRRASELIEEYSSKVKKALTAL